MMYDMFPEQTQIKSDQTSAIVGHFVWRAKDQRLLSLFRWTAMTNQIRLSKG